MLRRKEFQKNRLHRRRLVCIIDELLKGVAKWWV